MQRRVAFLAAMVYTVLFEIAKWGIGLYLDYALSAYRYFYQGYTILVIVGVWAFYSAVLFVFSSVIARAYQQVFMEQKAAAENTYTQIS